MQSVLLLALVYVPQGPRKDAGLVPPRKVDLDRLQVVRGHLRHPFARAAHVQLELDGTKVALAHGAIAVLRSEVVVHSDAVERNQAQSVRKELVKEHARILVDHDELNGHGRHFCEHHPPQPRTLR